MKAMTSYFAVSSDVKSLGVVMTDEMADNKSDLQNYSNTDWPPSDKRMATKLINEETAIVSKLTCLQATVDTVKGETAVAVAYPSAIQQKATDAITKLPNGVLVLSEAKYLMKYAGKGPFRGPKAFKERISGKFNEMADTMLPDGESLAPLRVIVVTEKQLPYSIAHVQALSAAKNPPGSFSEDNQQYDYVLCSSKSLYRLIHNPPVLRVSTCDYHFFTL